jgi:hypothetical protein
VISTRNHRFLNDYFQGWPDLAPENAKNHGMTPLALSISFVLSKHTSHGKSKISLTSESRESLVSRQFGFSIDFILVP